MRSLVALVIAASATHAGCGAPPPDARTIVTELAPPPAHESEAAPAPAPTPAAAPRVPAITGVHTDFIRVLAATEDGAAAVTADSVGVRLWPTLDGTREPVVVPMNLPDALAIARDGDDFAIAGIDRVGALELVRVAAADGARVARVPIASERRYRAVIATAAGMIATRDDQAIERFDHHGQRVGAVMAPPGHRVGSVITRRGRTLALLAGPDAVRGRWLDLADGLAWGASTPALAIDPAGAVLAADGAKLAAPTRKHDGIAVVDLATGRRVVQASEDLMVEGNLMNLRPLGYTAGGLVVSNGVDVVWADSIYDTDQSAREPAVLTDTVVVGSYGAALALVTRKRTRYLGYNLTSPTQLVPVRGGAMLGDGVSIARIDDDFDQRSAPQITLPERTTVYAVDRDHALGVTYSPDTMAATLQWIELGGEHTVTAIEETGAIYPTYHAVTHIVGGVGNHATVWLGHLDVATGTIDREAEHPLTGTGGELFLVDPADAGGAIAMIVDGENYQTVTVTPVTAVGADGVLTLGRAHQLVRDDRFWTDFGRGEITMYGGAAAIQRRSPDRTQVARLERHRITLRDAGGGERWTVPAPAITQISWTRAGDLVVLGGGLARIDLATGALTHRQCGWRFGLWDNEPTGSAGGALCDAAAE